MAIGSGSNGNDVTSGPQRNAHNSETVAISPSKTSAALVSDKSFQHQLSLTPWRSVSLLLLYF